MAIELAVIIPSYNEKANVGPLLEKLRAALAGIEWEVIYVDDNSPDGTAERVWEEARLDPRVRCLKRVGRRGLSSACIEGMLSTSAPFLAVMDADLQHDEAILPAMLSAIKSQGLDIVVGSRYVEGGGVKDWSAQRVAASQGATRFARALTGVQVLDPMSGYFMLRREFLQHCVHLLNGKGFKILLDLLMSAPGPVKFREIPYTFRLRQHGESKLTAKVVLDYFLLVLDKTCRRAPWVRWLLALLLVLAVAAILLGISRTCSLP
ncbi:MAG: polyprenol monophosphomannose synthase [Candidatus Omnitrophica bacterium]|nr:polyprenol monophosphomannose synthase [Candidatus Omnitrophota bacterium]